MSHIDIEQLKRASPIAAVVERHGVELRGSGTHLSGRCPFHEDRTPSFCVYPETESFHCFGCGARGDVIDFVRRASGLGFREALERLGRASAPHAAPGPPPPPARRERVPALSLDDRLMLTAASELYHETLLETPEALRHLEGRGIPAWLTRSRRLGLSDGRRLVPYLKRRRLSLKRAQELGLLHRGGAETMTGRIVIPDLRGSHCGWMVGRATSEERTPKYRGLALPRPLLGYERGRRRLFVTEGPFDWLTLAGWGLPACALLGTQPGGGAMRLLERARSVVLVMDGDEPGRRAAAALAGLLDGRARVLDLPPGVKDVNELGTRPGGRETFFRLLDAEREAQADMEGGAHGDAQGSARGDVPEDGDAPSR